MIDDGAGAATAHTVAPGALGARSEASVGDIEHFAALTARYEHRRRVRMPDELEALERMPGVDMEGRNVIRSAGRALHGTALGYAHGD
jgi:hypothetical protein